MGVCGLQPKPLTLLHRERKRPRVDKVAGFLKVERTDETHQILISHPALKPDAAGMVDVVFSTRYVRHLASLLIEHVTYT
jgi:hypothetical protein